MKLNEIKPNKANPRLIKDNKFKKLCNSIREFPKMMKLRPIVIDSDGTILGGNMRYKALQSLGYKDIPDEWVKRADELTDAEKQRFIVEDNVGFGEWDFDLLTEEFDVDTLDDWGVDVPNIELESKQEAVEDDFDESKDDVQSICQPGDLWQLGEHRLMCGDSTKADDVLILMDGEKADLIVTDPPYGVSYTEKNEYLNSLGKPMSCPKAIENDSKTPQQMYDFWCSAFGNLNSFSTNEAAYYITAPQGKDLILLLQSIRDSGFQLKHILCWNKNNHVLGRCDYNYKHEPIVYGWKQKGIHHFYGKSKFKTSVWDIPKPTKNDLHPTMKPIELISACLLDCSLDGAIVIDLFGGSGSTLIACEQLNRKCRMMEFDPHYCDVIIARWEKLTGKKSIKL